MGGIIGGGLLGGAVYSIGANVSETRAVAADAERKYQSNGQMQAITIAGGAVHSGDWITPTGLAPGAYTIRAHLAAGTAPDTGDILDSDLALTSDRVWGRSRVGAGTNTSTLTITIKDGGGNTVVTGTVVLTATAT